MDKKKELVQNTIILTVGKICIHCVSFFLLPLYTSVLDTSEYGIFDLLITYSTIIIPIVNWQLDQGLFRFLIDYRTEPEKQAELFSTSLAATLVHAAVYILLFILLKPLIQIPYAYFLLIYVVLNLFSMLLQQLMWGLGDYKKYAMSAIISAVTVILLNIVTLTVFHMGVAGLLWSYLLSQAGLSIYIFLAAKVWRYCSFRKVNLQLLKNLYGYATPLVPNSLAWWAATASDRVVISKVLGIAANGIYTVANKFPSLFINFYNTVNLSWVEWVSLHFHEPDRDDFLSETVTQMFRLFASLCFAVAAAMPLLYEVMIHDNYREGYNQVILLLYAMLLRVLLGLYSSVYVAQKKTKVIACTTLATAVINLSCVMILVRSIGLYAGAISSIAAFGTMFLACYIDVNRCVKMRIDHGTVFSTLLVGTVLLFTYYSHSAALHILAALVVATYAVIVNRGLIKYLYGYLKNIWNGKNRPCGKGD